MKLYCSFILGEPAQLHSATCSQISVRLQLNPLPVQCSSCTRRPVHTAGLPWLDVTVCSFPIMSGAIDVARWRCPCKLLRQYCKSQVRTRRNLFDEVNRPALPDARATTCNTAKAGAPTRAARCSPIPEGRCRCRVEVSKTLKVEYAK